jgi:hypothetical protein
VQGQSRVDHVLHDQHVAALEGGVEILEEPNRGRAAGLGRGVAGELDEVDVVQDRQRARQVGEEDEARLQRSDEQRLPALVVGGDLRAELGDARRDLIRREVDLADPVVGNPSGRKAARASGTGFRPRSRLTGELQPVSPSQALDVALVWCLTLTSGYRSSCGFWFCG